MLGRVMAISDNGYFNKHIDKCMCVCVCVCVCCVVCEEVKERRVLGLSVACVRGHMHGCFDTLAAGSCVISVPVLTLWNSNACLICL